MLDPDSIVIARKDNDSFYIEDGEFILIAAVVIDLRKRSICLFFGNDAGGLDLEFKDFSDSSEFMEMYSFLKDGIWEGIIFYADPSGFIDWRETADV